MWKSVEQPPCTAACAPKEAELGSHRLVKRRRICFAVLGFDVDDQKAEALNRGESYIRPTSGLAASSEHFSRRVTATNDFGHLAECDAIIICVPTPLGAHSVQGSGAVPERKDRRRYAKHCPARGDGAPGASLTPPIVRK
jgi:hypothetical protein